MEKMNAITFTKTGHVLGVVTRSSQPEKAATPEEVAAGGFKLRSSDDNNIILEIPEDEISVVLVDYDTRVLYRPHLFVLEGGTLEQKPMEGIPPDPAVPPNLDLDGSLVTVTLPGDVTSHIDVLCLISGGSLSEPIVRSVTIRGTVDDPKNTRDEALILGAGDYNVAMFTPGYALAVFMEMVP